MNHSYHTHAQHAQHAQRTQHTHNAHNAHNTHNAHHTHNTHHTHTPLRSHFGSSHFGSSHGGPSPSVTLFPNACALGRCSSLAQMSTLGVSCAFVLGALLGPCRAVSGEVPFRCSHPYAAMAESENMSSLAALALPQFGNLDTPSLKGDFSRLSEQHLLLFVPSVIQLRAALWSIDYFWFLAWFFVLWFPGV